MSIATRPKRIISPKYTESIEPETTLVPLDRLRCEAPEQAEQPREAPEGRVTADQEAPDAGEGRFETLESEFTHGRSQS